MKKDLTAAEIHAKYGDPNERQIGGSHYQKQKIQHWDYVLANNIPYMEAQVIKYVSRWRDKNGLEDLEKGLHYLEKLIAHETKKELDKRMGQPMHGHDDVDAPSYEALELKCDVCRGTQFDLTPVQGFYKNDPIKHRRVCSNCGAAYPGLVEDE